MRSRIVPENLLFLAINALEKATHPGIPFEDVYVLIKALHETKSMNIPEEETEVSFNTEENESGESL